MNKKEKVDAFINDKAYIPLKFDEIASVLDVPKTDRYELQGVLDQLEQEGRIIKSKKGRYFTAASMGVVTGRYVGSERQFGFVIADDGSPDIFISPALTGGAMHGDRVSVKVTKPANGNYKAEGEVIRVLKRAYNRLVCIYRSSRFESFAKPDEKRIWQLVRIPRGASMGAADGQKVMVEITRYPENDGEIEGRVVEILGWPQETSTAILSIIRKHSLASEFPSGVLKEAERIPRRLTEADLEGRRDLRGRNIFTIDGDDAKDFDDAVDIARLPGGRYHLGVHIADVAHYVKEGSKLDREAFKRGTSVYIPGTVVPMLPARLSNGICSLNPREDRLALTVDMEIDSSGNIVSHDLFESVINSKERMTYNNATKILEGDRELAQKFAHIAPDLELMRELAGILRSRRRREGSVDFNFPESSIQFDPNGDPVDVHRYQYGVSNGIIEEFMLACNMTVAERFFWLGTPFIYRNHEKPDAEKLEALAKFLYNFGLRIKGSTDDIHPKAVQQLLDAIEGRPEERVISTAVLRSMMKARYAPENIGHFGLAARYYCHFTSPIRRYPDLALHRIIKEYLRGQVSGEREQMLRDFAAAASVHSSEREIIAEEAERDGFKAMMCIIMAKHIGEEYDGIISYVAPSGFFVELPNTVEGMVSVASIEDDYYEFDPDRYALIGTRTKKAYRIGDSVRVRVAASNPESMEIYFDLVKR